MGFQVEICLESLFIWMTSHFSVLSHSSTPTVGSSSQTSSPGRSQVHHQRSLLPEIVDALLAHPVHTLFGDAHVKVPQHPGEDDAHFDIRQTETRQTQVSSETVQKMDLLPAQTIPGSNMEWLKSVLVVAGKRRVAQPPLGVELKGVFEVVAVIHGPVVDRDDGLGGLVSLCTGAGPWTEDLHPREHNFHRSWHPPLASPAADPWEPAGTFEVPRPDTQADTAAR